MTLSVGSTRSPLTAAKLATLVNLRAEDAQLLLDAATSLCVSYLRGGECPSAVMDEAVIRTAGHIHSRQGFGTVEGPMQVGGSNVGINLTSKAVSPVRQSGAGALLSPYVRRTA